jgi:hypothetical protein
MTRRLAVHFGALAILVGPLVSAANAESIKDRCKVLAGPLDHVARRTAEEADDFSGLNFDRGISEVSGKPRDVLIQLKIANAKMTAALREYQRVARQAADVFTACAEQ